MRDASVGETLLLVNYLHQPAATPYRSSHAIFVREGAEFAYKQLDTIPDVMRTRMLSLRAFDGDHMMLDADLVDGGDAETLIARLFANPDIAYLHARTMRAVAATPDGSIASECVAWSVRENLWSGKAHHTVIVVHGGAVA